VVINSVVINDLNTFRAAVRPEKAEPVLVVDADAVLAGPIAPQRFDAWESMRVIHNSFF